MALSATTRMITLHAVRMKGRHLCLPHSHSVEVCFQMQQSMKVLSSLRKTIFTASCTVTQSKLTSKCSSSQKSHDSLSEFRNIYTFHYIVHLRVISRLKIYQTALTLAALPPGFFMYSSGTLSALSLMTVVGIVSFATGMLYVMSNFFRHVVGIMSVNQSENIVRISHLTFWGKRRDEYFEVSEIIPLSDMSVKPNDIYQILHFYNKPFRFYWFLRHGRSIDAEAIHRVFGKI